MVCLEEMQDANMCWSGKEDDYLHERQRGWLLGYCHSYAMESLLVQKRGWGESMKSELEEAWNNTIYG